MVASQDNNCKLKPIMNDDEISHTKNIDNNLVNKIIAYNQKQSRVKRR